MWSTSFEFNSLEYEKYILVWIIWYNKDKKYSNKIIFHIFMHILYISKYRDIKNIYIFSVLSIFSYRIEMEVGKEIEKPNFVLATEQNRNLVIFLM